ncbi:MAG: hypothetical protein Q9207_005107, partial [Kuettlingeria erythrocarpa]
NAKTPPTTSAQQDKKFWIACLFTSYGFGKSVDTPDEILEATRRSVEDLGRQIEAHRAREEKGDEADEMAGCVSVRINSGLFGVEWARTKEVLEEVGLPMVVVRQDTEDDAKGKGAGPKDEGKKKVGGAKEKARVGAKRKGPSEDVDENEGNGGGKKQTKLQFGKGK